MLRLIAIFSVLISLSFAAFPNGQFKHGIAFNGDVSDDTYKKVSDQLNQFNYLNFKLFGYVKTFSNFFKNYFESLLFE